MGNFGRWFLPLLAFLLPLGLYIRTLAPTYIPIDSAEFALCMHFWGVCHPPGFPLYTAVGKLFVTVFPLGTLIYKANLLSAILGAATILVVYLTLSVLGIRKILALALSLLLAVNAIFWEFSIAADVFTFATFLTAFSFYLLFKKKPFWAFFVLGLSASHFYLSAILAPLFIWYLWGFSPNWRQWFKAGLVFALGFWPQALMFWRIEQSPAINWGHAQGISGFWYFIRRQEFGSIFLLSNPALTFSLLKMVRHFRLYFRELAANFGVVLPILAAVVLVFGRALRNHQAALIFFCFSALVITQLTLLSTIDPTGEDNPFQINKFYLHSFVPVVLLSGMAVNWLAGRLFEKQALPMVIFLAVLIAVYTAANFKTNDYANNYFSENMVLDAMEQLPDDAVAITVHHIFYFGGLYEQKINGQFTGVKLLYFPNEKNRDGEFYQPELFKNPPDGKFIKRVRTGKVLGRAEEYVLSTIARNLDKPIYILQGTFEEGFFKYLSPYIVSYGLWWKVEPDLARQDPLASVATFENLANANVKFSDLSFNNQKLDTLVYAVAYHSTAIGLASRGDYERAIEFLTRSYAVRPKGDSIAKEIKFIQKIQSREKQIDQLAARGDGQTLSELGNDYFTIGNYQGCSRVFEKVAELAPNEAKNHNNLASCLAFLGQDELAKESYRRALALDPNLELAKTGLEALEQ